VYSLLLVCVLPIQSAHETAGAAGTRHSPRPPWGARDKCTARARCAARHEVAFEIRAPSLLRRLAPRNDGSGLNCCRCLKSESVAIHWVRTRGHTRSRHRPRKRAIQYSRAVVMESRGRGVLDAPLSRSMTVLVRGDATLNSDCVIPGWRVSARPQMLNCASGNLEIPGSMQSLSSCAHSRSLLPQLLLMHLDELVHAAKLEVDVGKFSGMHGGTESLLCVSSIDPA
jgi:hypothetical protein